MGSVPEDFFLQDATAGAGKTKLISTVVDNFWETITQLPNDEAFAYFYCDHNRSDLRNLALMLDGLVWQLSTPQNNDSLSRLALKTYHQKKKTGFGSERLKANERQVVLTELSQTCPQITLVVDALEECNEKTRREFIGILDKLVEELPNRVKILISSRQDIDSKRHFENGPNLEVIAIDNLNDTATFVNHQIAAIGRFWQENISSELKDLVCTTLVEKSGGM